MTSAPELRGFHLGMTPTEARKLLEDTTAFDEAASAGRTAGSTTVLIMAANLKPEQAEGIDNIHLTFVDNRVAVIKVTYYGPGEWSSSQDFSTRLAESLKLPKPSVVMTGGGSGNEKYRIDCAGFSVVLAYSFGVSPNVTLYSLTAQKLVDQRRELEENKKTRKINVTPGIGTGPMPRPPL